MMLFLGKRLLLTCAVRTRWVDYKEKEYDPSQLEPGW